MRVKNRPVTTLFLAADPSSRATWADNLGMESFLQAFSYDTPFLKKEKKYQRKLNRGFANDLRYIRQWALHNPTFGCGVLDERFGAAPPEWGTMGQEAWGLEAIPTPYEVACAVLHAPAPRFWKSLESIDPKSLSCFYWFLAGMPKRAIAEIFKVTPQTVTNKVAATISAAMKTPRFALWSLSTDLIPAATNLTKARAAAALWRGDPMTIWLPDPKEAHQALLGIMNSPYIRAQLATGRAYQPIPRPIYSPNFVWEDLQAKREWESEGSMGARWLMRWRMYLKDVMEGEVPSWVRIPERCPIYSIEDKEIIDVRRQRKRRKRLAARRVSGP